MKSRKTKVPVYYFDILTIGRYWGCYGNDIRTSAIIYCLMYLTFKKITRIFSYHHTISSVLLCGLRVTLSQFANIGYENMIYKHLICAKYLYEGLEKLGFEFFVPDVSKRIPTITTIKIPDKLKWKEYIQYIMKT